MMITLWLLPLHGFLFVRYSVHVIVGCCAGGQRGVGRCQWGVRGLGWRPAVDGLVVGPPDLVHLVIDARTGLHGAELDGLRVTVANVLGHLLQEKNKAVCYRVQFLRKCQIPDADLARDTRARTHTHNLSTHFHDLEATPLLAVARGQEADGEESDASNGDTHNDGRPLFVSIIGLRFLQSRKPQSGSSWSTCLAMTGPVQGKSWQRGVSHSARAERRVDTRASGVWKDGDRGGTRGKDRDGTVWLNTHTLTFWCTD